MANLKTFIRLSPEITNAIKQYDLTPSLELKHQIASLFMDKAFFFCFQCNKIHSKAINELKESC